MVSALAPNVGEARLLEKAPRGVVEEGRRRLLAMFNGGAVFFSNASFSGQMFFSDAHFNGGDVNFARAHFIDGQVTFRGAQFNGADVNFSGALFGGSKVNFGGAQFTGGKVNFTRAHFNDGKVTFDLADFNGSEVTFRSAQFNGGKVDFQEPTDWTQPPRFDPQDLLKPPIGLLLPAAPTDPAARSHSGRWLGRSGRTSASRKDIRTARRERGCR